MDTVVQLIPMHKMLIAFIPVLLAILIMYKWSLGAGNAIYAVMRMLAQLILVGYLLVFIFADEQLWITLSLLVLMIMASSWIALRTLPTQRNQLFWHAALASLLGGGGVLIIMIWPVLDLQPLYKPQVTIPLAGMIFANSMNTISLAMERLDSELTNQVSYLQARTIAFHTALIPIINSMFAVGLVSLPGMMTGQVVAGVSPLIAVRYQVIVMCMIFASAALSTACILLTSRKIFDK